MKKMMSTIITAAIIFLKISITSPDTKTFIVHVPKSQTTFVITNRNYWYSFALHSFPASKLHRRHPHGCTGHWDMAWTVHFRWLLLIVRVPEKRKGVCKSGHSFHLATGRSLEQELSTKATIHKQFYLFSSEYACSKQFGYNRYDTH